MLALPVLSTAERADGPFLWIAVGILLGLVVGFGYAAVRRVVDRRRR